MPEHLLDSQIEILKKSVRQLSRTLKNATGKTKKTLKNAIKSMKDLQSQFMKTLSKHSISYSSTQKERKGPSKSANECSVGTKMMGNDGNMWKIKVITKKDGTKYHRWVKV